MRDKLRYLTQRAKQLKDAIKIITEDRCVLHKILEPATPEVESALDSVGIEKTRFDKETCQICLVFSIPTEANALST